MKQWSRAGIAGPSLQCSGTRGVTRIHRIALVFEFPTLNGGERSMLAAVDRLRGRFEFAAIGPARGRLAAALRDRDLPLFPLNIRDETKTRLPERQARRRLLAAVQETGPDLVHANSLAMGRLTGSIAAELAVPTVVHLRDILKLTRRAVENLNQNSTLIAVSEATRTFHVSQGLDARRLRVLYNGVDCEEFRPRESTGRLKRELGLPVDAFLVLTVGQIGFRKALDVVARAAVRLKDRLPKVHYLLVGERNSSKNESIQYEQKVLQTFREAGLSDRLHVLGYRDDVARLMNEADLLVHAAHQEPLGRVLLEAAASGLPIVATRVGGTPEIVVDGESARLVPPRRPGCLAEAVLELCPDSKRRARLAANARCRAESVFSIERAAAGLAETWQGLLNCPKAEPAANSDDSGERGRESTAPIQPAHAGRSRT